jgi:hypothetical protein
MREKVNAARGKSKPAVAKHVFQCKELARMVRFWVTS